MSEPDGFDGIDRTTAPPIAHDSLRPLTLADLEASARLVRVPGRPMPLELHHPRCRIWAPAGPTYCTCRHLDRAFAAALGFPLGPVPRWALLRATLARLLPRSPAR